MIEKLRSQRSSVLWPALVLAAAFIVLPSLSLWAAEHGPRDFPVIMQQVFRRQKELGVKPVRLRVEKGKDASAFTTSSKARSGKPGDERRETRDESPRAKDAAGQPGMVLGEDRPAMMTLGGQGQEGFMARTVFDDASPTIRKRSMIRQGSRSAAFLMELDDAGAPFRQTVYRYRGNDIKVYYRDQDVFSYTQYENPDGSVDLKEWVWVWQPGPDGKTRYDWRVEPDDADYRMELLPEGEGLSIYRQLLSREERANRPAQRKVAMQILSEAMHPKSPRDLLARIPPPVYWNALNEKKPASLDVPSRDTVGGPEGVSRLSVTIDEPAANYPLLIDPTLSYGQWLGASGAGGPAQIKALAVEPGSGEIYTGGDSTGTSMDLGITMQGTYSGSSEGFVLEISGGASPTVNWGQWLGGADYETVNTLAVTGDEIFAGGNSNSTVSWETVPFQGTFTPIEGFVVKILDGGTPSLAWGQWLGGDTSDFVNALALTGDEIYAGGYSWTTTSWEAVTIKGTAVGTEGWVVEIADGGTPSLAWGQWLGGSGTDSVNALVVSGDEIFAGGDTTSSVAWDGAPFQGIGRSGEGFVVRINDGGTPSLAWGQWLGGDSSDSVYALAVSGGSVYAGGYSTTTANFETVTFQGSTNSNYEAWVIKIGDGGTPSLNWGQWLGGGGVDYVYAVAVNGSNIFAGGQSAMSTAWESTAFQGDFNSTTEGFVVEIGDGGTPVLNWGWWLGGTGVNTVTSLAVSGTEIYAGGYSTISTAWESFAFQGVFQGVSEAFLVDITDSDNSPPVLQWGQWLGATSLGGPAQIRALASEPVSGEIYAGGDATGGNLAVGVPMQGSYSGGSESFVVEVSGGASPAVNWGQWLGGSGDDYLRGLAVTGDEIYAGGESTSTASWESVTFQGTAVGTEGWVVEIADGGTPSLAWGQWLGGSADDYIYALAVAGNEIYAGGWSLQSTAWEAVTFQGTFDGGSEGFVVEIGDGGTPTLAWGQWIGGSGNDSVRALAVDVDDIFAGGYTASTSFSETATFQGIHSGGITEGYVMKIVDAGTPSLAWGQWLGGSGSEFLYALAVTGDELYAGGSSFAATSWEAVTFQGTQASFEGYVVEIADGGTPSLVWGQWLGGASGDYVYSLAVSGDNIYAGGLSAVSTSWEILLQGTFGVATEGFVVQIADGGTPNLVWGEWLGGVGYDQVNAVAVAGGRIYAGGYSDTSTAWEAVPFQGAFPGSPTEAFLVELSPPVLPSLRWGQWLGGNANEEVQALAVSGSGLFVGGESSSSAWAETVPFQGTPSGLMEGFVLKIDDGGTPSLAWGQWLGGTSNDYVYALALTGNEIFAAGNSSNSANWEGTFQGTVLGGEAFVVKITDGASPSLNWGQWLGGSSSDAAYGLAVSGDEIYAGGQTVQSTGWESTTFQGAAVNLEAWVVRITDGGTPTLVWGQWLGGTGDDRVSALGVNGSTVYAGGYSSITAGGWEAVTFQGTAGKKDTYPEGWVVEIADGASPSLVWGQWIGGAGADQVDLLAISGDQIYAGGNTSSTGFDDGGTFQGAMSGISEGFVVDIQDGGTPLLVWGQWIGGTGADEVNALKVNGNMIYAGGYITTTDSMETPTFYGTPEGVEGYVAQIAGGSSPSLNWLQWIGGSGADYVMALAASSDKLFVGGYSTSSASWESVTFQGGTEGTEAFVVNINPGSPVSFPWGQWAGGGTGGAATTNNVRSLAVEPGTGEIYAGGDANGVFGSLPFQGGYSGGTEGFVVEVIDGANPSVSWGQWLGGAGDDIVRSLAVTGDEIYAAGDSTDSASWESVLFQGAQGGGLLEGFVVEIADGGTPSLAWGQWLGGSGNDFTYAVAVTGDEIYAGGLSVLSTGWETVTFQGTSVSVESWVVEIDDGGTPTLAWGQWLGGDAQDYLYAMTVTGEEIYAGGYAVSSANWEAVSFQGSATGIEAWVVEINDGGTPTLAWGQWLGGAGNEQVFALAAAGDEIYAAGNSNSSAAGFDESVTFQGAITGYDGFVVEIDDGGTPSLAWGQWLGGTGDDNVWALAVSGNQIFAGGVSTLTTSWEAITMQGTFSGGASEGWVVDISDGQSPSLLWGQWLGGTGDDLVYAVATIGQDVYAGGYSVLTTSWEAVTFQGAFDSGGTEAFLVNVTSTAHLVSAGWGQWAGGGAGTARNNAVNALAVELGTGEIYAGGNADGNIFNSGNVTLQGAYSGGTEGFVVEVADGGTPNVAWGQWLGGTGNDYVRALAVTGDEIYVGGDSSMSTSWESVTFQGANNGGSEGFVVEIGDGGTPTLAWGQWLGGSGNENLTSLAVTGDEVYAGGYSNSSAAGFDESVSFKGAIAATDGFVVEISDGGTPTLAWGQWLGGSSNDEVRSIAVAGDEIYAGGNSSLTTSWEAVTFQGAFSGIANEGFVVKIADGGTPSLAWGQWLGGTGLDFIYALAVTGNELYAGGSSDSNTSWESVTFQGTYSGNYEGWVVEIDNGGTPTLAWGQWLGGVSAGLGMDFVYALAVTGDEIYAGGSSSMSTAWETVTFQGAFTSNAGNFTEGFVVEINDGGAPSLSWGQWLGGSGDDSVLAVAVNGDRIFAAGSSALTTSWEATTFQGAFDSLGTEGFLVEITDDAVGPPSIGDTIFFGTHF